MKKRYIIAILMAGLMTAAVMPSSVSAEDNAAVVSEQESISDKIVKAFKDGDTEKEQELLDEFFGGLDEAFEAEEITSEQYAERMKELDDAMSEIGEFLVMYEDIIGVDADQELKKAVQELDVQLAEGEITEEEYREKQALYYDNAENVKLKQEPFPDRKEIAELYKLFAVRVPWYRAKTMYITTGDADKAVEEYGSQFLASMEISYYLECGFIDQEGYADILRSMLSETQLQGEQMSSEWGLSADDIIDLRYTEYELAQDMLVNDYLGEFDSPVIDNDTFFACFDEVHTGPVSVAYWAYRWNLGDNGQVLVTFENSYSELCYFHENMFTEEFKKNYDRVNAAKEDILMAHRRSVEHYSECAKNLMMTNRFYKEDTETLIQALESGSADFINGLYEYGYITEEERDEEEAAYKDIMAELHRTYDELWADAEPITEPENVIEQAETETAVTEADTVQVTAEEDIPEAPETESSEEVPHTGNMPITGMIAAAGVALVIGKYVKR